jgi:hypothetical protein
MIKCLLGFVYYVSYTPSFPKCLTLLNFYTCLTVHFTKNFCEICKTIGKHKIIFNKESNNRKIINNYVNFLNKMNAKHIYICIKVNHVKHLGKEGVFRNRGGLLEIPRQRKQAS